MKHSSPTPRCIIATIAVLSAVAVLADAAEFFVTKHGSDENDGATRATAFLPLQKGVNALSAGDTLTIGARRIP